MLGVSGPGCSTQVAYIRGPREQRRALSLPLFIPLQASFVLIAIKYMKTAVTELYRLIALATERNGIRTAKGEPMNTVYLALVFMNSDIIC